jgi:hypothetical protein
MDPAQLDDIALGQHMTTLTDAQLSDVIAAVDAAEVLAKSKTIDMGASALWYATKLGWPVFPLKPRGKKPVTAHGFKDATTDPDRVRDWWKQTPDANIGVPTGATPDGGCGFDVMDVDGSDGIKAWAAIKHGACTPGCSEVTFCDAVGPFDIRAEAFTPGDGVDRAPGRHLYVPATGKGNTTRIGGQSIDWRGRGGFVVVPPSVGLSGARYSWIKRPAAGDAL